MQIELDNVSLLKSLFEPGENSEVFQKKIADFFPAIIIVYNTVENKIRYVNKQFTTVLGYTYDDLKSCGYDLLKLIHPEDVAEVEKGLSTPNTLKLNDTLTFKARLIDNSGTLKYFRIQGADLHRNEAGIPVETLFVLQDITEFLQLEEESKASKDLLKQTERLLSSGTFRMDIRNKKLEWSDGMFILFGYNPGDRSHIRIDDDFYSKHMAEDDLRAARILLENALQHNDQYVIETPIHTSDNLPRRLETFGNIIRDQNGQPITIIGITRDITTLKDYENTLQQKIGELNESNKELEEFAYIASHDLQEPLRKITAFSERLQERSGQELSQDGHLYLQRILTATQNMRLLIDNLLEFSRTNRHNDPLEKIDLNAVVKEVLSDLDLKVEETNAVVEYSSLPVIATYHSQMKQLFTNILANAIKFRKPTEPPHIKISSETVSEKEKSERGLVRGQKYFKICVSDDGIGFEQEYALKIFQIFQRLHGKAEYPGTGIGLAICKKIVDNHRGVLFAQSSPGNGAVFTIILPENQ